MGDRLYCGRAWRSGYSQVVMKQNALIRICLVELSILINWTSQFPVLRVSGVLFHFYYISKLANSEDPDRTPRSAASDLGLHCCLPMS